MHRFAYGCKFPWYIYLHYLQNCLRISPPLYYMYNEISHLAKHSTSCVIPWTQISDFFQISKPSIWWMLIGCVREWSKEREQDLNATLYVSVCTLNTPSTSIHGFMCAASHRCIPYKLTCDNADHCPEGEDEQLPHCQKTQGKLMLLETATLLVLDTATLLVLDTATLLVLDTATS